MCRCGCTAAAAGFALDSGVAGFAAGGLAATASGLLFGAAMPAWILAYQRGMLRWEARLAAYHACLVEEYPPFSFDTGAATPPAMVGAQHT